MYEWREVELGDILHLITDYHSNGSYEILKENVDLRDEKDYAIMIRTTNFEQNNFTENLKYINKSAYEFLRKSKVMAGDIIMNKIANAGSIYSMPMLNQPVSLAMNLFLIRIDEKKANQKFIYYNLKANEKYIKTFAEGSVTKTITKNAVKNLTIRCPSIETQAKIVEVLESLEQKIENLRSQNQTLEKIAQTLFDRWFIDFEFPNDSGEPYKSSGGAMIASELGDIPVGWRVGKLGDEFEIIMGQSPAGSSFTEDERGMIFFQGRTDFGFRFPKTRMYTTEPKRIAEESDVLVSVRAPVGDVNIAHKRCCIGRGLAAVRSKRKSYCFYKLKSFKKFFDVFESEGTVFGSINKQGFNNLESCIPSHEDIDCFDKVARGIDNKILNNSNQIQTLTKTRDTLLPKLMSGQIRIPE